MKKIIFALSLLLLCSCSYLDVVPEGKATEEDIWKTEEQAENYRYYMQTYMPNLIGYDWSPDQFAGDDFITGARGTTYYFSSKSLLYGEENANLTYFGRWAPNCTSGGTNYDIYRGIRYCFYLLDNIYKVPAVSQENADRYAGEAWFLVGYYHQCLLEYYGPIVLVKKFIPIDAPESEILTPRTPYDECVKYIAECYDRAAGLLPDVVGESELGLPTKMAALSYKARLLLYAASPLVNGNPDYIGFNNPDGTPLMSTTYDPEKWKRALDAAAAAIALADEINPDTKKPKYDLYTSADSSLPDDERGRKNYHDTFVEEPWNGAEFILAKGAQSGIQALQRYGGPRSIKGNMSKGWKTTLVPTMEAVEMYYTKNGLPLDVDPLTKDEDLYSVAPGDNTARLHRNREPRFYMSVFYEGLNWIGGSNTVSSIQFYYGGNSGQTSSNFNYPLTGYLPFKFQDTGFDSKNAGSAQANWTAITWPLFRYAEVLLNYAEALNRQPERDATAALAAINAVRKRAGVADIETIYPEVEADADALEAMIRRERMIELNFENHRFFDTRMWLIAEQENAGAFYGMNIQATDDRPDGDFWHRTVVAADGGNTPSTRIFNKRNYLLPIPQSEIDRLYNVTQNYQW